MHFLAPFGHLYGVFRQNGQQIETKNAFSRTAQSKNQPANNTVRARTWLNTTERSLNYGKKCIFLHRSAAFMVFSARTLTKLWQKMHFLAPFGHLYGVFRPNGHQIEAKCIYTHCSVEKLARNNTVRARTWRNITERSPNYGKKCISSHHSATFMVFSARTVNICHTIMAKAWLIPTSNAESATVLRPYRPLYD